jgi:hypothetical protein
MPENPSLLEGAKIKSSTGNWHFAWRLEGIALPFASSDTAVSIGL